VASYQQKFCHKSAFRLDAAELLKVWRARVRAGRIANSPFQDRPAEKHDLTAAWAAERSMEVSGERPSSSPLGVQGFILWVSRSPPLRLDPWEPDGGSLQVGD
jgi:hypothetical protein